MMLVAVGLNHQTAPIALRERVAMAPESLAQAERERIDRDHLLIHADRAPIEALEAQSAR